MTTTCPGCGSSDQISKVKSPYTGAILCRCRYCGAHWRIPRKIGEPLPEETPQSRARLQRFLREHPSIAEAILDGWDKTKGGRTSIGAALLAIGMLTGCVSYHPTGQPGLSYYEASLRCNHYAWHEVSDASVRRVHVAQAAVGAAIGAFVGAGAEPFTQHDVVTRRALIVECMHRYGWDRD